MTKNYKKKTCIVVGISILVFLLTSCRPSDEQIQMAIAATQFSATKTQVAMITPTPTIMPLEEIDFSKFIFQVGDLPADFEPSQIRTEATSNVFENTLVNDTKPINVFIQELSGQDDGTGGVVTITVYKTNEEAIAAYELVYSKLPSLIRNSVKFENIGDKSMSYEIFGFTNSTDLMFVSCQSIINIDLVLSKNLSRSYDVVMNYAPLLQTRIDKLVCR